MSPQQDDESQHIVDAWRSQRPDLDTSPMLVFSRLSRLSRYFDLERREAFAAHGLEPWEFDVLAVLRRSGGPFMASPGALMSELLVSSGTMTNRIDRLQEKGLVERQPSLSDRRAILVRLTEKGKRHVDAALETLLKAEAELLSVLSFHQQDELARLLFPLISKYENEAR